MPATPYVTTDTLTLASGLTSVTTAAATSTTPYGYAGAAQADAVITQLNLIIALLKANGMSAIS